MLEKLGRLPLLLDLYGPLLTARQHRCMDLYYQQDWSLGEIAAALGVTRQAVHDLLRRAEHSLEEYEARLGLLERERRREEIVRRVEELLDSAADLLCSQGSEGDESPAGRARRRAVEQIRAGRDMLDRVLG